MRRYILTAISLVIIACAVSVAAYAGNAMQGEYLASADRLRVRAAVETDAAKKEEYIKQAEKYEQMADALDPIESDAIFQDRDHEIDENGESFSRDKSTRKEDKIRRDYERARNIQEKIDKLTCASCRDEGSGGSFAE